MIAASKLLGASDDQDVEDFVASHPARLIYYSKSYRTFLSRVLPDADFDYFIARVDGKVVGLQPSFTLQTAHGVVVNSLPFFGSYGSPLVADDCQEPASTELLRQFDHHCEKVGADTSTIVGHPFVEESQSLIARETHWVDHRTAQFINWSHASSSDAIDTYHSKTRNAVRKAQAGGFQFGLEDGDEAWNALQELHTQNISALGGVAKTPLVFSAVQRTFDAPEQRQLWVARETSKAKIVAALLLLRYADTIEYFIPGVDAEYRSSQVFSGLVHRALSNATADSTLRLWNWGGTWPSQRGVHRFKARWGSNERAYKYRVRMHRHDRSFVNRSSGQLVRQFPYFYSIPFDALREPEP